MRNIFDQYSQPENRLTHALLSALHADSRLVRPFVREVARVAGPLPRQLRVTEQSLPGDVSSEEEELDNSLPDACIYSADETWALIIENKVASRLNSDQLDRHCRTMERRGFTTLHLLAITAIDESRVRLPQGAVSRHWSELYSWLRGRRNSDWSLHVTSFMEAAEARWTASGYLQEGTLTEFTGYHFGQDQPVHYREAKRVQGLAMRRLRTDRRLEQKLYADLSSPGRSAITGTKTDAVWDYIPLKIAGPKDAFTKSPHLTHGISQKGVDAMLTFPNGLRSEWRRNLVGLGQQGFCELVLETEQNLRELVREVPGSQPLFRGIQRHYQSRRARPTVDALLEFDLRTALPKDRQPQGNRVSRQNGWLHAAYEVFTQRQSNYQIQIGALFPFGGPESKLATKQAADLVADAWIACEPMLRAALG